MDVEGAGAFLQVIKEKKNKSILDGKQTQTNKSKYNCGESGRTSSCRHTSETELTPPTLLFMRSTDFRLNVTHPLKKCRTDSRPPQTHKDVFQVKGGKTSGKTSTASCCAIFAKNVLQRESGETNQEHMITLIQFLLATKPIIKYNEQATETGGGAVPTPLQPKLRQLVLDEVHPYFPFIFIPGLQGKRLAVLTTEKRTFPESSLYRE